MYRCINKRHDSYDTSRTSDAWRTHTRGNDFASARSRETALLLLFWLINSYTEHLEMFYHVEVAW